MTRRDTNGQASNALQDEDIRALLDAQPPTVSPADLDERIRREAHAAAHQSVPTTTAPAPTRTLSAKLGPWFAVAAAVVLTVLLVPLLPTVVTDPQVPSAESFSSDVSLTAVESDAERKLSKARAPSAPATQVLQGLAVDTQAERREEVVDSTRLLREEATTATDYAISAQEDTAAKLKATRPAGDSAGISPAPLSRAREQGVSANAEASLEQAAVPLASQVYRQGETELDQIALMSESDIEATYVDYPYRRNKSDWWSEILTLHQKGKAQQVVREVRLFERMYPGSPTELPGG